MICLRDWLSLSDSHTLSIQILLCIVQFILINRAAHPLPPICLFLTVFLTLSCRMKGIMSRVPTCSWGNRDRNDVVFSPAGTLWTNAKQLFSQGITVRSHQKRIALQRRFLSLIKYRCEYFCSLLSLKSLMTLNSILQKHLKEPYAYRQPYQRVNPIDFGHIAEMVLLVG